MENRSENKIIITVSGVDRIGIVAKVAAVLADYKVNIEDIKQSIMQDYFVMFLLGDISQSEKSFKEKWKNKCFLCRYDRVCPIIRFL